MRFLPAVSLVQIQLQPPFGPVVKRPKTPPFHGGNTSSNLVRVTKKKFALYVRTSFFIIQRFEQDGFAFRQNSDLPADGPKGRVRVGARQCAERISSGSPKIGKSRWRFADFYFFTFNFSLFTSIYNRFLEGNM